MKKLPYREGTWFAVPLKRSGFAVGVVARASPVGKVILCYFFGPRHPSVPELRDIEFLRPHGAVKAVMIGDLGLIDGTWPMIGYLPSWDRTDWTTPVFVRSDPLSKKAWRVYYSDTDPLRVIKEEPEVYGSSGLQNDSLYGSGAVEIMLDSLLD